MGGFVPLGFDAIDRELVVNRPEAGKTVRMIIERFAKVGSATKLVAALRAEGCVWGSGASLSIRDISTSCINNRVYIGEAVHKGTAYPGQQHLEAIVDCCPLGPGARCPGGKPA